MGFMFKRHYFGCKETMFKNVAKELKINFARNYTCCCRCFTGLGGVQAHFNTRCLPANPVLLKIKKQVLG